MASSPYWLEYAKAAIRADVSHTGSSSFILKNTYIVGLLVDMTDLGVYQTHTGPWRDEGDQKVTKFYQMGQNVTGIGRSFN